MTSRDFCYWLQGYLEIRKAGPQPPEPHGDMGMHSAQVEMIQRHLALVFKAEIDPSFNPTITPALNQIHNQINSSGLNGELIRC